MSDWDFVYFHLASLEAQLAPASLAEQIAAVFRDRIGDDPLLAETKAESRLKRYAQLLRQRVQRDEDRGLTAFVRLDTSGTQIDWKHISLNGSETRSLRMQKIRLLRRPSIVRQIRRMDPNQFERIFHILSYYCKVHHFHITEHSDEFGIDSLAVVDSFSSFGLYSPKTVVNKLVVQSKKYQSSVSRDKIQILNDTLNLIRTRSTKIMRHVPSWFWTADGTIAGWVIADNGFQAGTVDYARDNGVMLSDIYDLANIICGGSNFDPFASHDLASLLS